jgi:hypothetical protein
MKTVFSSTITLTAVASLLLCSQASAFTDDFNSYTDGDVLADQSADLINANSNWLTVKTTGPESDFTLAENPDGLSATMSDTNTSSGGASAGFKYQGLVADEVTISFDYYVSSIDLTDGFNPTLTMNNYADGAGELGLFLQLMEDDEDSSTGYSIVNRTASSDDALAEVSLDTWYSVTITASAITDTYTITLQEYGEEEATVIGTDLSFRASLSSSFDNISFIENNTAVETGSFSIDNLTIIPESSQYAMLAGGLALAMLMLKRRIRR